jgi:cytoskeletal protein RodZ
MKKNQSGFSAIAALLILVIVGIVGGTGWYVMQANKSTDDTLSKSGLGVVAKTSKNNSPAPEPQSDLTVNWTPYSSTSQKFSVKYPQNWGKGLDTCYTHLVLWANTQLIPNGCHSENLNQISVSAMDGDQRAYGLTDAKSWKNTTKELVTVDGVKGEKQTATASGQFGVGALDDGAKQTRYIFYTNGKTYFADYIQTNNWPDVLSDFNLMITKTLKFSTQ